MVVPRAKILMLEAGYQEQKERSGGLQGGMLEMDLEGGERERRHWERESERARIHYYRMDLLSRAVTAFSPGYRAGTTIPGWSCWRAQKVWTS